MPNSSSSSASAASFRHPQQHLGGPPSPSPSAASAQSASGRVSSQQNGSAGSRGPTPTNAGFSNGFSNVSRSTTFVYSTPPSAGHPRISAQSSNKGHALSPPLPAVRSSSVTVTAAASLASSSFSPPPLVNHPKTKVVQQRQQLRQFNLQQQPNYLDAVESECLEHYESNLEKYKDERDAIQKKTFTKWVNQHLIKNGKKVEDLFVDLRDGHNLIDLLQALSAEILLRENGFTRFHRIQNVQSCLEFLKHRNIKLVNIRPEDIVEGNAKLTLGLIWTIILNFQVSVVIQRHPQPPVQDVSLRVQATSSTQSRTQMLQQTVATTGGIGQAAGSGNSAQRTVHISSINSNNIEIDGTTNDNEEDCAHCGWCPTMHAGLFRPYLGNLLLL